MYANFKGKKHIPLWCGGKECANDSRDAEWPQKKKIAKIEMCTQRK